MKKNRLKSSQAQWHAFAQWEKKTEYYPDFERALHLIGEWADFFLAQHPQNTGRVQVAGIMRMHGLLSCL